MPPTSCLEVHDKKNRIRSGQEYNGVCGPESSQPTCSSILLIKPILSVWKQQEEGGRQ